MSDNERNIDIQAAIDELENGSQITENAVEHIDCDSSAPDCDNSAGNAPIIEIRHLGKNFGDHEVLKDIDFDVYKGDVTCIIGSSGSGKSTLLRCINLFETPTAGEIYYHGEDITKTKSA